MMHEMASVHRIIGKAHEPFHIALPEPDVWSSAGALQVFIMFEP